MAQTEVQKARYATELWFREQGLPYFVQRRSRGRKLLSRSAPALLFFALAFLAWSVFAHSRTVLLLAQDNIDFEISDGEMLTLLSLPLAVVVLPLLAALISRRLLRNQPVWANLTAWLAIGMQIIVDPLVAIGSVGTDWWSEISQNVLAVVAVLALTWLGLGSFLGWSVRAAFRQLSAIWLLAAIALPLLMLVVIFAFYSQETWQMAASLERGQIFWLLIFLLALGLLFVVYSARKELRDLPATLTVQTRQELRDGTPLAHVVETGEGSWKELSRLERANVVWVMVLAQCFQVLIFGVLVFAFMMALAALSIPAPLAVQWSNQMNVPLEMFGLKVPIAQTPVRVSAFLAAIAALNFVVSVNSSKEYRDAFFDPLIKQTGQALAVHAAYQEHFLPDVLPDGGGRAAADSGRMPAEQQLGEQQLAEQLAEPNSKPGMSVPDDIVES